MRIRSKISLFVIPLTLVPLLLIGFFSYRFLIARFEEQISLDNKQLCSIAATQIESILDECAINVQTISSLVYSEFEKDFDANNIVSRHIHPSTLDKIFQQFTLRLSPFVHLRFISPEGMEFFRSEGMQTTYPMKSVVHEPQFLLALTSGGQLPALYDSARGRYITTFINRLSINNSIRGFIFIDLDMSIFANRLRGVVRKNPAEYFLMDGSGTLLSRIPVQEKMDTLAFTMFRELQRTERGNEIDQDYRQMTFSREEKNYFISLMPVKEYIAFSEPVPEERWYIGVVRSEVPLLAGVQRTQTVFFIVVVIGLIVAVAGTLYLSRRFTKPIDRLTLTAQKYARGDLLSSAAINSSDEFGELSTSFTNMARELQRHIDERQANETLIAIGKFSSALTHDLRNPVEGLKLLSHELLKRSDPTRSEHEVIDTIAQSVNRLSSLIAQSLDFARMNKPIFTKTDIAIVVHEIVSDFAFDSIGIKLEMNESTREIEIDAMQIKRVLSNLLKNAYDACYSKLKSGCITLRVTTRDDMVRIEVSDTGVGIPRDSLDRIYEPFFTTKPTGHGLGLVRQIISNHNGHIECTSTPDHGTTFIITLPVSQRDAWTHTSTQQS